MKIRVAALAGATRTEWLEIVVHGKDPSLGLGRVKARALPQLLFDHLQAALQAAMRRAGAADADDVSMLEELRQAESALVQAMVIDHDPRTFFAGVPTMSAGEEGYADLVAGLVEVGYTTEEAKQAVKEGGIGKAFTSSEVTIGPESCRKTLKGASAALVDFYRYCQPNGIFISNLLSGLQAFQAGEVLSAQEVWDRIRKLETGKKIREAQESNLLPFAKAPTSTP